MDSIGPPIHEPGSVIAGKYRLERQIGAGGFGMVFAAEQLDVGRKVALKLLLPRHGLTERFVERFTLEAQLARRLEHPNTVRLYDWGQTDEGELFIAWQYLVGRPLDRVLAEDGPFSVTRATHVGVQVLQSLMEAHELGIIHRDIKPANIFLCEYAGASDFVKLLDFGIAKATHDASERPGITDKHRPVDDESLVENLTEDGELMGTPAYMSPEQVLGKAVSAPTDLYALGLVLAELLSGQRVMVADSAVAVVMKHASTTPVPLPSSATDSAIGWILEKATAKDPKLRFETARQMHNALSHTEPLILAGHEIGMGDTMAVSAMGRGPALDLGETAAEVLADPVPRAKNSRVGLWIGAGLLALVLVGGCGAAALLGVNSALTERREAAVPKKMKRPRKVRKGNAKNKRAKRRVGKRVRKVLAGKGTGANKTRKGVQEPDFDLDRFEPVKYIDKARAKISAKHPKARLTAIYILGVKGNGRQRFEDMQASATYYFRDPDVTDEEKCILVVSAGVYGTVVKTQPSYEGCKDEFAKPKCSIAEIRRRARAKVPLEKTANVAFNRGGAWSVSNLTGSEQATFGSCP